MVAERKKLGWSFVFMGSDMDAWQQAQQFGYSPQNVQSFAGGQTTQAWANTARNLVSNRAAYACSVTNGDLTGLQASLTKSANDFYGDPTEGIKEKKKKNDKGSDSK